ncbi:hypothetical protein NGA_0096801 [Nannochloropsis gaditana CCMP526]|uniref:uncharacterized protein n=1 Tax=Nannochloropsis gaditana (strain CCMP526) TaxID=1093141 RepID=UPI00029F7646|nr:hypothetical protein NGA_0096801 [Nannochloropsis gaditana CCMP526]EKU20908.1 hypothetical protein NGA_0096801 [Nannochloropsis gaditana CCMP526]|eukprot:XP_005855449.1 hypothetical protein NGA_0096801 [Nannochloropsis gaditana CCMP526]
MDNVLVRGWQDEEDDEEAGSASPEPWYIDPTRPRALEAALALLGVQVEYLTRFTADEVNTLVVRTGLTHIQSNISGYVLPSSGNVRRRSGIRDADKTRASIDREEHAGPVSGGPDTNRAVDERLPRMSPSDPNDPRPICKPQVNQASYYSEYYKAHGFKFQGGLSVTGLFQAFFGPEGGKEKDSTLWAKSCVSDYLNFIRECRESDYCDGGRWSAVGDPAYNGCK